MNNNKKRQPRDHQVEKVYRAETLALEMGRAVGKDWARLMSMEEMRAVIRKLRATPAALSREVGIPLTVGACHGNTTNGSAVCKLFWGPPTTARLEFTPLAMTVVTAAHELAHFLSWQHYEALFEAPAHGAVFCGLVLTLLREAGYEDAAKYVAYHYSVGGVAVADQEALRATAAFKKK